MPPEPSPTPINVRPVAMKALPRCEGVWDVRLTKGRPLARETPCGIADAAATPWKVVCSKATPFETITTGIRPPRVVCEKSGVEEGHRGKGSVLIVNPPKIETCVVKRAQHRRKKRLCICLVCRIKRNGCTFRRVEAHVESCGRVRSLGGGGLGVKAREQLLKQTCKE